MLPLRTGEPYMKRPFPSIVEGLSFRRFDPSYQEGDEWIGLEALLLPAEAIDSFRWLIVVNSLITFFT